MLFAFTAIIDSGAAENFIDQETVTQLNIPMEPLPKPRKIQAIDGGPIGGGFITHRTLPLLLQVGALHQEYISLLITQSPKHPLILGFPWMEIHNPQLSWSDKQLTRWSSFCYHHCLQL